MRMVAGAAALVLAGAAAADEHHMVQQRCVWQCLANARGADDPAYAACVAARCSEAALGLAPAPAPTPAPAPAWTAGVTSDGGGMFAGTQDPEGRALYVICQRGGGTYLALFGPEGPDAELVLRVDRQAFRLAFRQDGAGYYAPLQPGTPVIGALFAGTEAEIHNGIGTSLLRVPLAGAGPAISRAFDGCR